MSMGSSPDTYGALTAMAECADCASTSACPVPCDQNESYDATAYLNYGSMAGTCPGSGGGDPGGGLPVGGSCPAPGGGGSPPTAYPAPGIPG
jgi:hypothetical protein